MRKILIATVMSVVASSTVQAQEHPHPGGAPRDTGAHAAAHAGQGAMTGPLGIPMTRDGSGTSWLPDSTPMYAFHVMAGPWQLMLHGNAFLQYIDEGSDRGARQLGSVNWFMGMGRRKLAGGLLDLRAMLSAEPATVGRCGYPDLLATGEFCHGVPLHDRQHPHDLFMELSARYDRAIARGVAFELYGAPSGEPALGPVAFPHRISAMGGPLAPISHHWQDATHIAFGVATAGVYGRKWKLEGSLFNGREPDEDRGDIDLDALDSYSGRFWLLPSDNVAIQVSTGFLKDAEEVHEPGGRIDVHRSTASLTYHRPRGALSPWATTLVWGQDRAHGRTTNSALVESSAGLSGRNVVFGRAEWVQKSGEDLALPEETGLGGRIFPVGKVFVGYVRQFPARGLLPGIGAQVDLNFVPSELERFYGSTTSAGFAVFASVHPAPMRMGPAHAMGPVPAPAPGAMPMQHPHTMPMEHTDTAGHEQHRMPQPMRDTSAAGKEHMHGVPPMHADSASSHQEHEMPMPRADSAAGMHGTHRMPADGERNHASRARPLSLRDVTAAFAKAGVALMAMDTVRQPFWSVPSATFMVHGAKTANAALHVNVYPSDAAAQHDAAKVRPGGGIGGASPHWVAPVHIFRAGNALLVLLADPKVEMPIIMAAHRAVQSLGGEMVAGPHAGGEMHHEHGQPHQQ